MTYQLLFALTALFLPEFFNWNFHKVIMIIHNKICIFEVTIYPSLTI